MHVCTHLHIGCRLGVNGCVLQDVDILDTTMPETVRAWIYCVINSVAILFVIAYVVPPFGAVIIPLLVLYFIVLVRLTTENGASFT
jgi:hypothetical protein